MSTVGADLVEAFEEMASLLRGEIEVESYEVPSDTLTPSQDQRNPPQGGAEHEGL